MASTCRYCGAELTAAESIERGYGRQCGLKAGVLEKVPWTPPERPSGASIRRRKIPEGYDWRAAMQRYLR